MSKRNVYSKNCIRDHIYTRINYLSSFIWPQWRVVVSLRPKPQKSKLLHVPLLKTVSKQCLITREVRNIKQVADKEINSRKVSSKICKTKEWYIRADISLHLRPVSERPYGLLCVLCMHKPWWYDDMERLPHYCTPPVTGGFMMTSSNGNIFRVTGLLCGEFTGPRWILRTKASDAELWCFLWSAPE